MAAPPGWSSRANPDVVRVEMAVANFRQWARDLRVANKDQALALTRSLRTIGNIVAGSARAHSSWSTRIPGSVRVRSSSNGLSVVAGGEAAPHAVTFEGNQDGSARKHPVFARGPRNKWTWAPQTPRPFMRPAMDDNTETIDNELGDVLESIPGYR